MRTKSLGEEYPFFHLKIKMVCHLPCISSESLWRLTETGVQRALPRATLCRLSLKGRSRAPPPPEPRRVFTSRVPEQRGRTEGWAPWEHRSGRSAPAEGRAELGEGREAPIGGGHVVPIEPASSRRGRGATHTPGGGAPGPSRLGSGSSGVGERR